MRRRPCKHIRRVHRKFGSALVTVNPEIPQTQRRAIILAHYQDLRKDLKREGRARVSDFGIFKVKRTKARPARKGMNPFTKQLQTFKAKPASRKIKFFPAQTLKEEIQ